MASSSQTFGLSFGSCSSLEGLEPPIDTARPCPETLDFASAGRRSATETLALGLWMHSREVAQKEFRTALQTCRSRRGGNPKQSPLETTRKSKTFVSRGTQIGVI